jgi:hypothetical protein
VEESNGEEEEDPQEVGEDPQEVEGTQEETQAAEEAQDPLFQEDSWSEEGTIPEWQERCCSSSLETELRQNSS